MRLYPVLNFALIVSVMASLLTTSVAATAQSLVPYLSAFAEPLPVDRGAAAVWQSLKKLQTRASIMMVVGHGHLTANRIFTARLVDIHPDVDQRDKKSSCKGLQFVAAANRIDARENDIDVAALRSDLGPIRQPLDDVGGWIYGLNDTLCV